MKLSVKNIGKIAEAEIEISGITVIAGENNTGKSTMGKALYAVFNGFYRIKDQIFRERVRSISRYLSQMYADSFSILFERDDLDEIAGELIKNAEEYSDLEKLKTDILSRLQRNGKEEFQPDSKSVQEYAVRVQEVLRVTDEALLKSILKRRINAEFSGQACGIYGDGRSEITLNIQKQEISVTLYDDEITEIRISEGRIREMGLNTEAIYMDDPFILDETRGIYYSLMRSMREMDHRNDLCQKLHLRSVHQNLADEVVVKEKLETIYQKLSAVCDGDVARGSGSRMEYREKGRDKGLDVRNLSTGLKTFVILKMLLVNGEIGQNGTLILDEPEIHLHPEWQLLFAELIVLIQKEFGVHVLLNTHSPYFLNAIEVYSKKYGVEEQCRYYLSDLNEEGDACLKDVTGDTEQIYRKLAQPLQALENEEAVLQ